MRTAMLTNVQIASQTSRGLAGTRSASLYASELFLNAQAAAAAGWIDTAISLADQCVDFCRRRFGDNQLRTRKAVRLLIQLKTS
jgi:hypothetical protein